VREVLRCEELATGAGYYLKVEAARPEWEEEEAKPPEILAAGARYHPKSRSNSLKIEYL